MMTSEKHASAKATIADTDESQSAEYDQADDGDQVSDDTQSDENRQVEEVEPEQKDTARPELTVVSNNVDPVGNAETQASAPALAKQLVDAPTVVAEKLVHEGDDGWLFLVAGSNHVLNMYQHKSSFTPAMARAWVDLLKERSRRLSSKGIQYLHLPAPEKLTVLHKFYRDKIENIEGSPIHQMVNKHAADVPCIVNVLPLFASGAAFQHINCCAHVWV